MKKILKVLIPLMLFALMSITAYAYNVVDLPEEMTFAEALGVFDSGDISNITISDIGDESFITLSADEVVKFYDDVCNLNVTRTVNPTPYRGISVNIYKRDGDVMSYLINSGMPIGLYGSDSYICYKLSDSDTEDILYLVSDYYDTTKEQGETLHRADKTDFLKLPDAGWAKNTAAEAASKSLLPYEFTSIYPKNISREQFCILLGNMIAVKDGYYSIETYMESTGQPYLKNYFVDCAGVDNSVNILYAMGIVTGTDETHFDPEGELTREQAAVLLGKTAARYWTLETIKPLQFADVKIISPWAEEYVAWASEHKIMSGITPESFVPQGAYTVEQAISTIVRLYNLLS